MSKWSTSVGFLGYNNTRGAAVYVLYILERVCSRRVRTKCIHWATVAASLSALLVMCEKALRQLIVLCSRPQMQPKYTYLI